jgi:flagellar protein FlbD
MIRLIRADGVEILLNVDMIKSIEAYPETTIILTNGEKLVVKNHPGDITEKIKAYQIGSDESEGEESDENGEK